jgi:Fe2+ or Zn2+ uptake regulation protein
LNELVSMGELLEVSPGQGAKRYDPNVTEHHQHLVCMVCNALLDVHPAGEADLVLPPRERHGYEVIDVDVVFRGRCPKCQRRRR